MNKQEYKQKLLIDIIPDISYVLDLLSQTEWYLAAEEDKNIFKEKLMPILENNIDSLDKFGLEKIVSAITASGKYKEEILIKLMDKTIEFQIPLITPYHCEFNIFTEEQKINYVELLNKRNYSDLWYLNLKLSNGATGKVLTKIYNNHYYNDGANLVNKFVPNEKLNLFILNHQPDLFFNNTIITKETKENLLNIFLEESKSVEELNSIMRLIRAEKDKVNLNKINILEPIIIKIGLDESKRYKKKGITRLFELLKEPELAQQALSIILNSEKIKAGYLSTLKKKVELPNDYDIPHFKNPVDEHTNINFLQYLMFQDYNYFVTELCKKDKDFMKVFNNCIHKNVQGFNYEKSPLDLALNGVINGKLIEPLYVSKIINDDVKDSIKDKVCAFLFKSFIDCSGKQTARYKGLLNAISLMPSNLFNKYANYYKYTLESHYISDKVDKQKDIETIRNMLDIKQSLPKSDNNQNASRKLKL